LAVYIVSGKFLSALKKIVIEDEENDLSPLMPLYRYIYQ
jgi:hypothetical protein